MLRIKKLDIFLLKSFGLMFMGTFFICLFIFMMQFLWKYVNDMIGKGFSMSIMAQFFYYSGLMLIPMSLPLAVLLASLITFGNFGERFELLAMKAAGISLMKIMRPLIIFVTFISCLSFYFQNVIGPKAQTKLWTLIISMKQKSPELDIPEGIFYDEIDGYNLYVRHKNRKTGMLYDVLIYNVDRGFENTLIIKSDSGRLEMTSDKQHLLLHLYNGEQFENLRSQRMNQETVPYRREEFAEKHAIIEFDSEFTMVDEGVMSGQSNSKNLRELQFGIDSMTVMTDSIARYNYVQVTDETYKLHTTYSEEDTLKIEKARIADFKIDSLLQDMPLNERQGIYSAVSTDINMNASNWGFRSSVMTPSDYSLRKFKTAWHEKFTLSLACIIFFFIGAPLGGIIRKGGLGMPVVVSVLIFIFYYIVNNTGYKMAREGKWIIWMGMWTSTAVLAPIGAFLTYKSNNDSVVLNMDTYLGFFKKLVGIRSARHIVRKDVIIEDPNYTTLPDRLKKLADDCQQYAQKTQLKKAPNYFKMWFRETIDEEVERLNERLEALIEEMGNARHYLIIARLNCYPEIQTRAHVRPFKKLWLNAVCAIVFPIGLLFYFRIWAFRIRLDKDIEKIVDTSQEIIKILKETPQEELNL